MIKIYDHGKWVPFGMHRYKIEGDKVWSYTLNAKKMRAFLAKKYPSEKNIISPLCQKKTCVLAAHVSINKLNKNVYKILASIPDTKEFWTLEKEPMAQKMP